jgi:transcriptional regulator with XRE-family HTH domain
MLRMTQVHRIHADKTPQRYHYIPEWAAKRNMRQKDIVAAFPLEMSVDKGTVSRWFNGSLPKAHHLEALATIFQVEVNSLFRHPDDDWIAQLFRDRSEADRDKAIAVLKALFPPRTGTDG